MIEEYENLLRCREHFRENIHLYREAFVRYYGEERRKEIEEKFDRAIFLAYRNPESTSHYISNISKCISDEIMDRELERLDSSFTKKDLFEDNPFEFRSLQPISHYKRFYDAYILGPEGREEAFKNQSYEQIKHYLPELTREEYEEMVRTQTIPPKYDQIRSWLRDNLKYFINVENGEIRYQKMYKEVEALLHKVDPDITLENLSYYIDNPEIIKLNALAEIYPSLLEEYDERMKKYQPYKDRDTLRANIKSALNEKYFIKFVEENIDLIPENEREGYEKYKRKPSSNFYELGSYTHYIFGYGLSSNHPLDAFTTDSCKKLEDSSTSSWKKDAIKRDRVEFFKRNGIDLGNDYDAYIENEKAKKVWPTEERANYFMESRNRLLNAFNIEYYSNTPEHQDARREIEEKHFLDKEDSFNAALYTRSGQTFVNPNLIETKDGYDLFSIIAVCCDNETGHIDHDIIHELNHLFELSLKEVEGDHYDAICGWDVIEGSIHQDKTEPLDTLKQDENKRQYELFSEIINELIAQEICEEFTKDGTHVFDTEKNATTKNTTGYEHTFFLVRDFFQEFKKEIIESRTNGNIEVIWNKVGKENFDALNDLFHVYFEHFQGFKFYSLMQSLKNKEDNEQTRVYYDLLRRRDEILEKMRKESMLAEEKPKKGRKKKETTK